MPDLFHYTTLVIPSQKTPYRWSESGTEVPVLVQYLPGSCRFCCQFDIGLAEDNDGFSPSEKAVVGFGETQEEALESFLENFQNSVDK